MTADAVLRHARLERVRELVKGAQVRLMDILREVGRDERDAVLAEVLVDGATYARVVADLVDWAIARVDSAENRLVEDALLDSDEFRPAA